MQKARRKPKPRIAVAMKEEFSTLLLMAGTILAAIMCMTLSGCGSSEEAKAGGSCTGREISASSGRCFVIECDGRPVGGNCL